MENSFAAKHQWLQHCLDVTVHILEFGF